MTGSEHTLRAVSFPSRNNLRRVDATGFHLADEEPEAERESPPCSESDQLPPPAAQA